MINPAGYRVLRQGVPLSLAVVLALTISLNIISCRHPIEPGNDTITPGRRDYAWKAETLLINPGNDVILEKIWANSSRDAWCVGFADQPGEAVWHYTGTHWSKDSACYSTNYMSIFGFSNNDIWTSAEGGDLWHYQNNKWYESATIRTLEDYGTSILQVWGTASWNCYAVGGVNDPSKPNKSVIAHWDGDRWSALPIPDIPGYFAIIYQDVHKGAYFVQNWSIGVHDTMRYYMFNAKTNTMREIYKTDSRWFMEQYVAGNVYFSDRQCLYTFDEKNGFTLWRDFSPFGKALEKFYGRSEKDIFAIYWSPPDGDGIMHYNGSDAVGILFVPGDIADIAVLLNDIFVLAYIAPLPGGGLRPVIYHGTLASQNAFAQR